MDTCVSRWRPNSHHGFSLLYASAMSMLLLFSCLAYLKWSLYSTGESHRQVAEIQAYYTAQAAIIQNIFPYLHNHPLTNNTWQPVTALNDGYIPGMGKYEDVRVTRYPISTTFPGMDGYEGSAVGIAKYKNQFGKTREVRRRAFVRLRRNLLVPYFLFTNQEQTRFNEFIWFFNGDSILGPIHSNSNIGVHPGTYFGGLVTTCGYILSPVGSTFAGLPGPGYFEHVSPIPIPCRADGFRSEAASSGNWLNTSNGQYIYGLWFHGTSAMVWRWRTGTSNPPYPDPNLCDGEISWSTICDHAIFCDGELWIRGVIHGRLGVGAHGNLRIYDNITYYENEADKYPYRVNLSMHDMTTLISEAYEPGARREDPWTGILIANTPANGREGGRDAAPVGLEGQYRRDVAIHASLYALNSSFTFEQQNDTWEPYQAPQTLANDERGYIYLVGAVCQQRRGYVHRSNHGGTGYLKSYVYDPRFKYNVASPPFAIDLVPEGGMGFKVDGWFDDYANRSDIGEAPYERHNPSLNKRQ